MNAPVSHDSKNTPINSGRGRHASKYLRRNQGLTEREEGGRGRLTSLQQTPLNLQKWAPLSVTRANGHREVCRMLGAFGEEGMPSMEYLYERKSGDSNILSVTNQ